MRALMIFLKKRRIIGRTRVWVRSRLIQRASKELLGILGAMALAPNMAVTPENVSGVADVVERDVRAAASYAKSKLRNGPGKVQKDFEELSWNELSALVKVIQSLMAWVKRKGSGGTEAVSYTHLTLPTILRV